MAKATETQIKQVKDAIADGSKPLPAGVRINFGDVEPIQKADADIKADAKPDGK